MPSTCLTRNSTTRPSAERSLHHCSFRSEKNQRAADKLITLLKKVCCQLRPVHELSSPGSSSSREMENETREELQKKSHVLKVEELSRRKLTEDFLEVTSYFQGSNVKTVYNLGDNDAKYPDAEIDDEHIRNSLASPLYLLRSEKQVRACCKFITRKRERLSTPGIRWVHHCTFRSEKRVRACCRFITRKEKVCFNVHSQFSVSTERPVIWMSQKRKSNQELDNCQFMIILDRYMW